MVQSDEGRVLVVVGGPGAGKSTACRLVAEQFERSVYHAADRIREDVVRGFAAPQLPYSDGVLEQFALGRTATTFIARQYCAAGFTVVVDDSFACHVTDGYSSLLDDPSTIGILLSPSKETLIDRMSSRGGPFDDVLIGLVATAYDDVFGEIDLDRWHLIDNSALSVDETVQRIIQVATDARR